MASRTAAVVGHFSPKLAAALSSGTASKIKAVLVPVAVAGWVAGAQHASSAAPAIASGVSDAGLDLGAPDDADPEWAETASLDDAPQALSERISDLANYADNLASFVSPLDADDQADTIVSSVANGMAETSAQAAYAAGGVSQWDFIVDSDNACQECSDAADGGPYDVGDGPSPPLHDGCDCESSPETDSSEARSGGPMTDTLWSDIEWRAAMSTKEINNLPDSDFAYIEPGGEKDEDGKTTPRSLRHYPIHDEAHVRNALARAAAAIAGDDSDAKAIAEKAMPKIKAAAKKFGIETEEDAAGDNEACNRCNGEGTINLDGDDVECPQCGGSGDGTGNASSHKIPAAYRADMRGITEQRVASRSQFELREVPNGTGGTNLRFTGFASVTGDDAAYEMEDMLGPWTESVSVGSFAKTLSQNADVAFLLNHTGMTLARTKPGTLKLSEETEGTKSPIYGMTGLHSEADLDPQNMYVQAMRSAVDRGDLDEMSFAFRVLRQEWNNDYTRRWINEVSLDKGDVSLVNYGANPTTGGTVTLRQKLGIRGGDPNDRLVAIVKNLRILAATYEVRQGKVISSAIQTKLEEALAALHATDDTDIPGIVKALQAIDAALDSGQAGISAVLNMANPDGDPNDLEPALTPPPAQQSAWTPADLSRDRLALAAAAPRSTR